MDKRLSIIEDKINKMTDKMAIKRSFDSRIKSQNAIDLEG
jgi:hypothetical protein